MRAILITGAHGFIGRHLARHFKAHQSHAVYGLGHGTFSGSELRTWGLTNSLNGQVTYANLQRISLECGTPDVIFHLAGGSSVASSLRVPQEDFLRTVSSTCELLEWARTHALNSKIILASSAAVYGAAYDRAIDEADEAIPHSPYGYHKRMAELLCDSYAKNFGLRVAIVRFFSVYGPELRKQLLWDTCQRLASGERQLELHGSGRESRDWLHVSDCTNFLSLVAKSECIACPVFNCGTGVATDVRSIAQQIGRQWNEDVTVRFSGNHRVGDPRTLISNPGKALALGWKPKVDWQEGVDEYVRWFKANIQLA